MQSPGDLIWDFNMSSEKKKNECKDMKTGAMLALLLGASAAVFGPAEWVSNFSC